MIVVLVVALETVTDPGPECTSTKGPNYKTQDKTETLRWQQTHVIIRFPPQSDTLAVVVDVPVYVLPLLLLLLLLLVLSPPPASSYITRQLATQL